MFSIDRPTISLTKRDGNVADTIVMPWGEDEGGSS